MRSLLAFIKQKSADQSPIDNKTNSRCNLSTSSLEQIKLNVVGLYQQQPEAAGWPEGDPAGQRHARRSRVCRHYCKDHTGRPGLAGKSSLQVTGTWVLLGGGSWLDPPRAAAVRHRDPKQTCFGDHKLPTRWTFPPFHCCTISCLKSAGWWDLWRIFQLSR